jgi:antibiotic biosynthesis monooxygenase (ABM) superfamily enzyme
VPTITLLQLTFGGVLEAVPLQARAPILATIAVPIVVYVLMPRLQGLMSRLIKEEQR